MKKRKSFRCPQRLCSHKYQKVKHGLTADYLVCYNCGKIEKGEFIPDTSGPIETRGSV